MQGKEERKGKEEKARGTQGPSGGKNAIYGTCECTSREFIKIYNSK
jgi:hypothetical protein